MAVVTRQICLDRMEFPLVEEIDCYGSYYADGGRDVEDDVIPIAGSVARVSDRVH